jgi:hypothetical protein
MLLWELTFEKIPYQGWDMDKVQSHVTQGKREKITFGPAANERELDIQNGLEYVIREGMHKIDTSYWIATHIIIFLLF